MSIALPSAARILVTAALTVTGLAATVPSVSATDSPCPTAAPVSDAVKDAPVHGLTVSTGTVPDTFTGSVLGVLQDGIAPGVDLILADLDSPELERVGGIWAGMSGSPVYTEDGRLLGAVSYGFAVGPSRVAGITPAEDMYALLAKDAPTPAGHSTIALPTPLQSAAVDSGAATSDQADSGLTRLPVPLAISGLSGVRRNDSRIMSRLTPPGAVAYAAASAPAPDASNAADPGTTIVAGGNLAAGISYGDVSAVAVGTATAVCDSGVVAFGHPFLFNGPSNESLHGADAIEVQDDPTTTPFKLANPTAPVGTITQDRLTGIVGHVGTAPTTIPVTSSVDADGVHRDGRTDVVESDFLPDLSAFHILSNVDTAFDRIGAGVATVRTVVNGTRGDGTPWTFDRTDRVADPFDVSFATSFPIFDDVAQLQQTTLDNVSVSSVDVTANVTPGYTDYELQSVQVRAPDGQWVTANGRHPAHVVAGDRLRLQVHLHGFRNSGDQVIPLDFVVPPGTAGSFGSLSVTGGGFGFDDGGDFGFGPSPTASSFDDLLSSLQDAPRADDMVTSFHLGGGGGGIGFVVKKPGSSSPKVSRTTRTRLDRVVLGDLEVPVVVGRPAAAKPGYVRGKSWSLRQQLNAGPVTSSFSFGTGTGTALMGDFDGDGKTTPATFAGGVWRIRPSSLAADTVTIDFGAPGDRPIVGDWNGDGREEIGVLHGNTVELRDGIDPTDTVQTFDLPSGLSGRPVAGDWNGDGIDTVGVVKAGTWTLLRANRSDARTITVKFGDPLGTPVVGDWNRDGRSDIGTYRAGVWLLRDHLTSGRPDARFVFGTKRSSPVVWR